MRAAQMRLLQTCGFLFIILTIVFISLAIIFAFRTPTTPTVWDRSQKVILLGFDGLGMDNIASVDTPNLDAIMQQGVYAAVQIDPNSYSSGPNWAGMLTGHTSETSGISNNDCVKPAHETLFDMVPSAVFSQWSGIKCYSDNITRYYGDYQRRNLNMTTILDIMTGNESFVFLHVDILDHESHTNGASSPYYKAALTDLDSILPHIQDFVNENNATLIISADHGSDQTGYGHSWGRVPIIIYGKNAHTLRLARSGRNRDVFSYIVQLLER